MGVGEDWRIGPWALGEEVVAENKWLTGIETSEVIWVLVKTDVRADN